MYCVTVSAVDVGSLECQRIFLISSFKMRRKQDFELKVFHDAIASVERRTQTMLELLYTKKLNTSLVLLKRLTLQD